MYTITYYTTHGIIAHISTCIIAYEVITYVFQHVYYNMLDYDNHAVMTHYDILSHLYATWYYITLHCIITCYALLRILHHVRLVWCDILHTNVYKLNNDNTFTDNTTRGAQPINVLRSGTFEVGTPNSCTTDQGVDGSLGELSNNKHSIMIYYIIVQ